MVGNAAKMAIIGWCGNRLFDLHRLRLDLDDVGRPRLPPRLALFDPDQVVNAIRRLVLGHRSEEHIA